MGLDDDETVADAADIITKLYKMFIETDATMIEINPLAETSDGKETTYYHIETTY